MCLNFKILFTEAPSLAKYALMYLSVVRDTGILRLETHELEEVDMTLLHYYPMGGINPHVDTVHLFNDTLGPIFTVALGPSEKALDILPLALPDSYKPVRVYTKLCAPGSRAWLAQTRQSPAGLIFSCNVCDGAAGFLNDFLHIGDREGP
jgi:hypothetical protein